MGHPNGAVVPVDEPAVAAARADHLAAKFGVSAGPVIGAPIAPLAAAPVITGYAGLPYAAGYGYSGPLNLNTHLVAHPNGAVVPADEPAVAAARADHLIAQGASYAAAGPIAPLAIAAPIAQVGYVAAPLSVAAGPIAPLAIAAPAFNGYAAGYGYSGPLNLNTHLVAHPNGAVVPADEPAVVAARADHLAARGASYAAAGPIAPLAIAAPIAQVGYAAAPLAVAAPAFNGYAAGYGYSGPLNLNTHLVAHPNGAVVPADEPAVVAARADHLAARGASYAAAGPILAAPAAVGGVYAQVAPAVYGASYGLAPYGGLVAHPNGAVVPVDEPAVLAARADHLALLGASW